MSPIYRNFPNLLINQRFVFKGGPETPVLDEPKGREYLDKKAEAAEGHNEKPKVRTPKEELKFLEGKKKKIDSTIAELKNVKKWQDVGIEAIAKLKIDSLTRISERISKDTAFTSYVVDFPKRWEANPKRVKAEFRQLKETAKKNPEDMKKYLAILDLFTQKLIDKLEKEIQILDKQEAKAEKQYKAFAAREGLTLSGDNLVDMFTQPLDSAKLTEMKTNTVKIMNQSTPLRNSVNSLILLSMDITNMETDITYMEIDLLRGKDKKFSGSGIFEKLNKNSRLKDVEALLT